MKNTTDEEKYNVSQLTLGSNFSDISTNVARTKHCRINRTSKVRHACYYQQRTNGSIKFGRLLGLLKFGIVRSTRQRLFVLLTLLVVTILPLGTDADYDRQYASKAMKNFSITACEKDYLYMGCPDGTIIDILHVMYGRKVPSTELCPRKSEDEFTKEENINCEVKVGAECQGKRFCRLLVHHRVFGVDPCPGTSKYLSVQYQCVPKFFQKKEYCSYTDVRLRCRRNTAIGIYEVTPNSTEQCQSERNSSVSGCLQSTIFDDVTAKCHLKTKCSYSVPRNSCFNHLTIKHICVPNSYLTTEIPTYDQLQATTAPTTTFIPTTQGRETTTADENVSTVQPTVTTHLGDNDDSFAFSSTTSKAVWSKPTDRILLRNRTGYRSTTYPAISSNTDSLTNTTDRRTNYSVTSSRPVTPDVENDFPMEQPIGIDNSTGCTNCSASYTDLKLVNALKILAHLRNNRQDMYIALLLGVIVVLLLTICILLFQRREKFDADKDCKDSDQVTEETREDNRQNIEEHHSFQEVEEPAEEDEHENMSLLGSILQRSVDSNNTVNRPHISPNASYVMANTKPPDDGRSEQETCGPKSIFGKICCNCCCSNPPWQRTRILKRNRGDVYHVEHRYSSSIDEDDIAAEFRSHETFPKMSRVVDNANNPSPIPVLEERVNRTEQSFVTSPAMTSSTATPPGAPLSQSQQNFRPISRNTQRHHSVTPELDSRHRVQQTFQPRNRQPETQRSDPALNRYTVRQQYNVSQPLTAPTSPVVGHHSGNTPVGNGAQHLLHVFPSKSQKPVMGSSMLHTAHPPPPVTPKYTPPPNHFFNTHQYPAFPNTYEQYDNAPEPSQAVRRNQFPSPRDYSSPYNHNFHGNNLSSFPTLTNYDDDFVQAVQYRNTPSNARAIDLAANARTVDLSHDNTVSRNSWIEIRRSSIYDNSLPRNSEMFDYYQQFLPHEYQVPSLQQFELPGSRNLNHYYP